MGFESQEAAESFAEAAEFRADQKREERLLEPQPHKDDEKTLAQIEAIGAMTRWTTALEDAYHLGRIRGRMEGAEAMAATLSATLSATLAKITG